LVHCPKWLAAVARVCDERILLGARRRRSSWCGHGDGQGPASLTFAGAADWLAGWLVWGVGVPARGWQVMGGGGPAWWWGGGDGWPGVVVRCRDRLAPANHSVLYITITIFRPVQSGKGRAV